MEYKERRASAPPELVETSRNVISGLLSNPYSSSPQLRKRKRGERERKKLHFCNSLKSNFRKWESLKMQSSSYKL